MTNKSRDLIAGEPVHLLLRAIKRVGETAAKSGDGTFALDAALGLKLAQPLVRALMRIESELLLQDANAFRGRAPTTRSPDDRSVDAIVELGLRLAAVRNHSGRVVGAPE